MFQLIIRIIINTFALWFASYIVPGIQISSEIKNILIVALIFGIINAFIKPILKFFSFPLMILTLGLFTLIINAFLLQLTAYFTPHLSVDDFISSVLGSIIISFTSTVLSWFVKD